MVIDYNCRNINVDSYNGRDLRLVNCYGDLVVVRVNKSISKTQYFIKDDKHDYAIAGFDRLNQYRVVDNRLYVRDFNPATSVGVKSGKEYYDNKYFAQGQMRLMEYDSIDEIPAYYVVDLVTDEVTLYKDYIEMSDEAKTIFQALGN